MIVKHIPYSDMNRNERYFKHRIHRISSIFHNLDPWHFKNIGGSIATYNHTICFLCLCTDTDYSCRTMTAVNILT
jgi:hypothetical protein